MNRSASKLLLTTAVIALAACSTKGPGELGSKNDIVVRNKGIPGAVTPETTAAAAPAAKAEGEDFSSTVEQGEAAPAPEVAAAEPINAPSEPAPLPDNSPAMKEAVEQQQAINTPVPVTSEDVAATRPPDLTTAPPAETRPLDAIAPAIPVTESVTPPAETTTATTAPATSNVYPAADYAAPAAPTAAAAAPASSTGAPAASAPAYVPAPVAPGDYPLDPNAPYSPKAVAAAQAANTAPSPAMATDAYNGTPAVAPSITASGVNLNDPAIIRSTQAALAGKGLFVGPQTGIMDAELLNAVTRYQASNNLPQGGINEATLKQLGVIK